MILWYRNWRRQPLSAEVIKEGPRTYTVKRGEGWTSRISKNVPPAAAEYGAVAWSSDGPYFEDRDKLLHYILMQAERNLASAHARVTEAEDALAAARRLR